MKKFTFSLARVLEWRATQTRIEESKLERLYGELHGIESREEALRRERADAERALLASQVVPGFDLSALDSFRRFTAVEQARLGSLRQGCSQRIAVQIQAVAARRRDVRLLERLRENRRKTWAAEFQREQDALAEEAFLAKWNVHRGR
jgi:hypothetical protein